MLSGVVVMLVPSSARVDKSLVSLGLFDLSRKRGATIMRNINNKIPKSSEMVAESENGTSSLRDDSDGSRFHSVHFKISILGRLASWVKFISGAAEWPNFA